MNIIPIVVGCIVGIALCVVYIIVLLVKTKSKRYECIEIPDEDVLYVDLPTSLRKK